MAASLDVLKHEAIDTQASSEVSVKAVTQILTGILDYEKLGSGP
jgi:hypothetical protein